MRELHWPSGKPTGHIPRTDEVHLWSAHLAKLGQRKNAFMQVLSNSEQSIAAKRMRDSDRLLSICSKGMLRTVLATYLNAQPRDLIFSLGPYGKPELVDNSELSFSLSHSGELVLLAVSGRDATVGVDLELRREIKEWHNLAVRHFHPGEAAELLTMAPMEGQHAFVDCWTRKEAVAKALGMGLSLELKSFRVSVAVHPDAQLLEWLRLPTQNQPWLLMPLNLADGYAASLAVTGVQSNDVHCWQFDPTEAWWQALQPG